MDQTTLVGGINPDRLYSTAEAATLLRLHPDTVYRIPAGSLRRTKIGPRRGRTVILGSDLLAYLRGKAA